MAEQRSRTHWVVLALAALMAPAGACDIFEEFPDEREPPDYYDLSIQVPGDATHEGRTVYLALQADGVGVVLEDSRTVPAAGAVSVVVWDDAIAPEQEFTLYWWVDTPGTADGQCDSPDDPQWLFSFTSPADMGAVIDISFDPADATGGCAVGA